MAPRKPKSPKTPITKQYKPLSMPSWPEVGHPHTDVPLDHTSFYTALGFMTATWAYVELYLDLAIGLIHGNAGGNAVEREIPRAFARKVTFLKKCFAQISILSGQKRHADALFARAKELARRRHFLIHGVALAGHKQIFRLVAKPYWHESETGNVSMSEIMELTGGMLTLANDLSDMAQTLVGQLGDIALRHSEHN
jgi:hypothetical protein